MSTFSDAWHAAPPHIHAFYNNWATRHTALLCRWWIDDPYYPYEYFNYGPGYFWRPLGRDVAYAQWTFQLWEWGYFRPEIILWCDWGTHLWQGPMPMRSVTNWPTWHDQFIDVPWICTNYPREKRKAPRTYWTGKPRHRRNL